MSSSLKPSEIKAQIGFWQKYGSMIIGGVAAGSAAAMALYYSSKAKPQAAPVTELRLPYRDTTGATDLKSDVLSSKMTLDDLDWDGKRVLMRTDYNVVVRKDSVIEDTIRIDQTLPTIRRILEKKGPLGGCRCIVILTHLGRPVGNYDKKDYTVEPLVGYLKQCLGSRVNVEFLPDCVGPAMVERTKTCPPGTVFLCENLRFHIEEIGTGIVNGKETRATPQQIIAFRENISALGDVFVFEAYGAAHRPHSSVVGVNLPQRVAGLHMGREMRVYNTILGPRPEPRLESVDPSSNSSSTSSSVLPSSSSSESKTSSSFSSSSGLVARRPDAPFVVVIGSAIKVNDKIKILERWICHADEIIITGGMAFTFKTVMSETTRIGSSFVDPDALKEVKRLVQLAKDRGVKLHLPFDHCITEAPPQANAAVGVATDETGIPDNWLALDIGQRSRAAFSAVLARARTIVWVGTVGCFEWGAFSGGTISILQDLVDATKRGAFTLIAGGDATIASRTFLVGERPAADQVSFVSSGGGSSLVLMEGKLLHGAAHLTDRVEPKA